MEPYLSELSGYYFIRGPYTAHVRKVNDTVLHLNIWAGHRNVPDDDGTRMRIDRIDFWHMVTTMRETIVQADLLADDGYQFVMGSGVWSSLLSRDLNGTVLCELFRPDITSVSGSTGSVALRIDTIRDLLPLLENIDTLLLVV